MNDCYYSNCDLYKNNEHCMDSIEFCEYSLREHDKQIRANAIDEMKALIYQFDDYCNEREVNIAG